MNRRGGDTATRAAIQGELGSFSHEAARQLLGPDVPVEACDTFEALFAAVSDGRAPFGVVPVENTLAGSVVRNLDLLVSHPLHAVAETRVRVRLCVAVRPKTRLEDVATAASHPVALEQCRSFFLTHPWIRPLAVYDTAGSVRDMMGGGTSYEAAIASELAAELYGAEVAVRGIEDDAGNFTRFLLVAREPDAPAGGHTKASVAFIVAHRPGSLHAALGILARKGIDLTRLESRPIPGRPWEYRFHADVRGDADQIRGALDAMRGDGVEVRILGMYPEHTG